jgi:Cu-processing system permease protein
MRTVLIIAQKEIRDALRNRWIAASALLLAALALTLALLGTAPGGSVKASALVVTNVNLASLSVYLVPLIALMLSFDALAGEFERGTMLLLLTYPVERWQVVVGKFCGHLCVLCIAIACGYGCAAALAGFDASNQLNDWLAFASLIGSSVLLGAVFLALGYLASMVVRERATAAGIAIGLWILLVVLYDLVLLGVLLSGGEALAIGEQAFRALLLANPTDAYRLFNLAGSDTATSVSGLASVGGEAVTSALLPLAVMGAWVLTPLIATSLIFQRREL